MAKKAAKKATRSKAVVKKKTVKKSARGRANLTPRKEKVGLDANDIVLPISAPSISPLVDEIKQRGGAVIGAYREPLSGKPVVLACLPLHKIQPTPFQRDLSPTHTKRLAQKIDESGSFLDPLIVVMGQEGMLWTPNGRHRLAAAKVLGLKQITALVSPDETLAFRILALNTEKAHNLKDRSLEVIRMARNLAQRKARSKESDYQAEFEAPEFLTLGIIYEEHSRFAGGAYSSFLKKVDRFIDRTLPVSIRQREGHAARLLDIDTRVKMIIAELQERGFKSPYLKNYVVARINPVRFHRHKKGDDSAPMTLSAALTRMLAAAKKFDVDSVNPRDVAMVAALLS